MGVESGEERDEANEARVDETGPHDVSHWRTDLGHEVTDRDVVDQKTGRVDRRLRTTGWEIQGCESVRMGVMEEKEERTPRHLALISSRRVGQGLPPRTCQLICRERSSWQRPRPTCLQLL